MQPHILFLGTGGDSIVVGKQYRASGGIVMKLDDHQFLIDPGPGTLVMAKMYGVNLRETTALLVSHNHINHANDVNAVISGMTHNGLDKRGVLVANRTVLEGTENDSPFLNRFYRTCVEKVIMSHAVDKMAIEDIDIRTTRCDHSDPDATGFKFTTKRFSIAYTADTVLSKEVAESLKNSDILIMNVVHPGNTFSKSNLNTDSAIKLINSVGPKLAVITHFGVKMLQADPLYEARRIQKETQVQTLAARDGMIINPLSFSSKVVQKTLKGY